VADHFAADYDRMVLTGVSLGGIVALIETLYEPKFTAYVPVLGTPFLAAMLLRSSMSRLVDSRFRNRYGYSELRAAIDFDQVVGAETARVIMINGRFDTMVDIALLRAWWPTRPGIEVHEVPVSHFSMALNAEALRPILNSILRRELGMSALDGASA